jgi:hypothetical protein
MTRIFYSEMKKKYYSPDDCICSKCSKPVSRYMFMVERWGKNYHEISNFCNRCFMPNRGHFLVETIKPVILGGIPNDAVPVLVSAPQLHKVNDTDLFLACHLESERETDHTVKAGRKEYSWIGSTVGNSSYITEEPKKDVKLLEELGIQDGSTL